jgi:hypothetical protein
MYERILIANLSRQELDCSEGIVAGRATAARAVSCPAQPASGYGILECSRRTAQVRDAAGKHW